MTELSSTQIQEIRTKVLGAAAKVPGALIGLGILFIVLGMIGVAGQVFFSFVSVTIRSTRKTLLRNTILHKCSDC